MPLAREQMISEIERLSGGKVTTLYSEERGVWIAKLIGGPVHIEGATAPGESEALVRLGSSLISAMQPN